MFGALALVASIIVGILAIPFMTTATLGVGCMSGACFLGILARLFQADAQNGNLLKKQDEVIKTLQMLLETSKRMNK